MKIKVKDFCVTFSYILVFVVAITYLRYTVTQIYTWRLFYYVSMVGIILLCILYMMGSTGGLKLNKLNVLLFALIGYELFISAFKGLFVMPMIFIDVISWPLLLIVFYDYCGNNELPKCFGWLTLLGTVIVCILSIPNIMTTNVNVRGSSLYATYFSFSFLPMVYLLRNKKESFILNIAIAVLMLLSTKRSSFIIIVFGIGIYYIMDNYVKNTSMKQMKKYVGLVFAFIVVAFLGQIIIQKFDLDIFERLASISTDGGSGRLRIWQQIIDKYRSSSVLEKVFGHGFHAVFYKVRPLGVARYAHNSFVETLYDYGILGLVLVLLVIRKLIATEFKMIRTKSALAPTMSFTVIAMLVLSSASYFFEQALIIVPFCVVWGICLGQFKRDPKRLRKGNKNES